MKRKFLLGLGVAVVVVLSVMLIHRLKEKPPVDTSPAVVPQVSIKASSQPTAKLNLSRMIKKISKPKPIVPVDPNADFFIHPVSSSEPQTEKSGSKFDPVLSLNGKILKLRGVTVRRFEMSALSLITIYTVALYVPEGADLTENIPDVEKVLILKYHLDVPKEKVVQAIRENVYTNPEVSVQLVEPYFQQLSHAFDSPRKGDRYEFSYIPGRGTAMVKAGNLMTLIPTRDFEQAFFGIWLSPHGKDLEMRCELLALPCPQKSILNPINAVSSGLDGAKAKLGKLKNLVS